MQKWLTHASLIPRGVQAILCPPPKMCTSFPGRSTLFRSGFGAPVVRCIRSGSGIQQATLFLPSFPTATNTSI
ncbi:hypothetical protein FB45DRAFT_906157 [Roridomyces roridus]|uniref:Uncharacterized protein n=1 Tax=Roridomyces roridus TaxID=1738132 RepID=A0AAD7FSQ9_9AGAR|nr:hypothetical protein FB45DRAFT_906157 [Roridomyces roridus]